MGYMKRFSLCLLAVIVAACAIEPAVAKPLSRSQIVLRSAISVDPDAQTVTLPLHRGQVRGNPVWYIITDASDTSVARRLGVTFAPVIADAGGAIQSAHLVHGIPSFDGSPNFAPARSYVAGITGFPPVHATPGGVGDPLYSPFVRIAGTPGILNAPIIATGAGPFDVTKHSNTADRVLAIDTKQLTVTLLLVKGFHQGKWVAYLSTDATDPVAASIERATFAPRLAKATTGHVAVRISDATLANAARLGSSFNPRERLFTTLVCRASCVH